MSQSTALESQANTAANETLAAIRDLEHMALDPTMEQCCRRDVQQQISAARLRHALQTGDRVDRRQRLAAATICKDASMLAAAADSSKVDVRVQEHQQPHAQHDHQQHHEQQSDDDAELQRLRQQRLRQLQAESAVKQEQRREGFGTLNTVPESSVWKLCTQDPPGRGLVVLHLAVQGYEPCNALDECLEAAAAQYRGTYFARCVVSRNSPLLAQLQLPHGIPALLVAKHCAVLGKANISQFGGADIWEEEVMSYLQRFKVLSTGATSGSSSTAAGCTRHDNSEGSGDEEEAEADWQTPCEVCGRTYPHEHIRSIYSSQHHESSDDDELWR